MALVENVPAIHFDRFISVYSKHLKVDLCQAFSLFETAYLKNGGKENDDMSDSFIYSFLDLTFGKEFIPELKSFGEFYPVSNMFYHAYHFNKHKKIYKFEPGITSKLTNTSLSKVDTFFLKSPFRSIYISIPHNKTLKITDSRGSVFDVEGFYVVYVELNKTEQEIGSNIPPGVKKFLRILAVGKPNQTQGILGIKDDCIYYLTFFFKDGDVFEEFEKGLFRVKEEDQGYIRQCFSFVMNALLYLTSSNPETDFCKTQLEDLSKIKNPAKIRKAEQRNSRLSKYPYYKVGKSILLGPSESNGVSIPHGPHRPFTHQWMVSGHWRSTPCGKNWQDRKLIWIEPHYKGKEFAEVINKDYIVR